MQLPPILRRSGSLFPHTKLFRSVLVEFDGFIKGLEVSVAEPFIPLALDDFEEDRSEHGLGEDLQQNSLAVGVAVDQDAIAPKPLDIFAMSRNPLIDALIIGKRGILETDAIGAQPLNGGVRSEEHTSELQSLMRISYAVFCLQKTNKKQQTTCITFIYT